MNVPKCYKYSVEVSYDKFNTCHADFKTGILDYAKYKVVENNKKATQIFFYKTKTLAWKFMTNLPDSTIILNSEPVKRS